MALWSQELWLKQGGNSGPVLWNSSLNGGERGQVQRTERHMQQMGPAYTRPEGPHRLWLFYQAVAWRKVSGERRDMDKSKSEPWGWGS